MIIDELFESPQQCPECGGISFSDLILAEKKDACYYKVKASAKVWPSAYASGRLVQCRKKGAANYGNKSEGVMEMDKSQTPPGRDGSNDEGGKKEYPAKIITLKKAVKDGEKILNKAFKDSQRVDPRTGKKMNTKGVAEGLDEAVGSNYLYHATSADGLKGILSSGGIRSATGPQAATSAQTKLPTVSVTRDWGYASGVNAQTQMVSIGRHAILVLDRNAVESNFKTLGTSQSTNIKGLAFNPYLKKDGVARSQNTDPMARNIAKAKAKNAEPTAKFGGEFEEAVVVPKGALPLRGTMVGFWVNPRSELMKDPSIMNDPRRLDMPRPNQFVKANQAQGVAEAQQLNVQQLATISDEALDKAYGYGRSQPGNSFGWQANLKSAAFAKQMIDQGVTDIEAISDAIHKGWNTTAQAFVQNPEQFDDTAKLAAAGKLEAKLQQRAQLMKQNYGQLPEEEKEKDRVVARALLQALKKQGVAEGKADYNFDIEDLKRLERIRDLATLKAQALALISKPSAKPMKPEKVEWFKNALERMNSPMKVIKLMYDLLLSGEGNAVVGTRSSMNPNSYRQRFGEQGMAEGDLNELSTEKLAQYKTAAGADAKKADASGNYARGDKRFKGINRATNKQFDNDLKKHGQQSVAEDADGQDMVTRIKQLAGMSPLKTVHGSEQRRYRDMPTAIQPPKK